MKRILLLMMALVFSLAPYAQKQVQKKRPVRKTAVAAKPQHRNKRPVKHSAPTRAERKAATYSNASIRGLQGQRASIQKKIREQEQALRRNQADVKKRLEDLMILNGEIDQSQKKIDGIQKDIHHIDGNIGILQAQLKTLQQQLQDRKNKYIRSMRYMSRHHTVQDKLMFIFSAKNLTQMYRRLSFIRQYSSYQKVQGEAVVAKARARAAAEAKKKAAAAAAAKKRAEELARKKAAAEAAARENARRIAEAKAREAAAEAARRKAAEEARQAAEAARKAQEEAAAQAEAKAKAKAQAKARAAAEAAQRAAAEQAARQAAAEQAARKAEAERRAAELKAKADEERQAREIAAVKKEAQEAATLSSVDRMLSGGFEANRGRLPMPISGGYRIVSHFGQYNVQGLKGVTLDNKGINIQGKPGCVARSIYDGEVSAVFGYGGMWNVLVRHGAYISVYCNLKSVSVHKGQKVSTRQALGNVGSDNILQFQLRKETAKLNPEAWLGR